MGEVKEWEIMWIMGAQQGGGPQFVADVAIGKIACETVLV